MRSELIILEESFSLIDSTINSLSKEIYDKENFGVFTNKDNYIAFEGEPDDEDFYNIIEQYEYQKESFDSIFFLKQVIDYLIRFLYYFRKDNAHSCQKIYNSIIQTFNEESIYEELLDSSDLDTSNIFSSLEFILNTINFNEQYSNQRSNIIPQNIKELNEEILLQLSQYPELIYDLEPRLFEELIGKIFSKFKLDINLTKRTRDGGIDIIAFEDNLFSKNKYIIECKRYNPNNKISVSTVQRLYGIKQSTRATKALFVTSSYFTKPAIEFAREHAWELQLMDFNDITKWLKTHWK